MEKRDRSRSGSRRSSRSDSSPRFADLAICDCFRVVLPFLAASSALRSNSRWRYTRYDTTVGQFVDASRGK